MNRMFGPATVNEAEDLVEKMLDDVHLRDALVRYLTHTIDKEHFGYEIDIIAENNEAWMTKAGEPWL